jgi:hypothetical protein
MTKTIEIEAQHLKPGDVITDSDINYGITLKVISNLPLAAPGGSPHSYRRKLLVRDANGETRELNPISEFKLECQANEEFSEHENVKRTHNLRIGDILVGSPSAGMYTNPHKLTSVESHNNKSYTVKCESGEINGTYPRGKLWYVKPQEEKLLPNEQTDLNDLIDLMLQYKNVLPRGLHDELINYQKKRLVDPILTQLGEIRNRVTSFHNNGLAPCDLTGLHDCLTAMRQSLQDKINFMKEALSPPEET